MKEQTPLTDPRTIYRQSRLMHNSIAFAMITIVALLITTAVV